MVNKEKMRTFHRANELRAEITTEEREGEWIVPPSVASLLLGIAVKKLNQMAELNEFLTITPLSSEKVRISKDGFRGSGRLYKELCGAVQRAAEGKEEAFKDLPTELQQWVPLSRFLESLEEGGGYIDIKEMQDLLQANWKTLSQGTQKNLEDLNPNRIISNLQIRDSEI